MAYSKRNKDKIFTEICENIANGMSLREATRGGKPITMQLFYNWLDDKRDVENHKQKLEQYTRACNNRADKIFEEILEISDDGTNDTYKDEEGKKRTDYDVIARSKLRVDARKWMLSKMNPKKYGDKMDVTTDGEKLPTSIPAINVIVGNSPELSDSEKSVEGA